MQSSPPSESSTSFPPHLEAKLNEFLQTMSPVKNVLQDISNWQGTHDAEHRKLNEELTRNVASHNFRISTLESTAGRGWAGAVRTALVVVLAAGSGYAIRAAVVPSSSATAAPAVTR